MQKVEGSSPISRLTKTLQLHGSFFLGLPLKCTAYTGRAREHRLMASWCGDFTVVTFAQHAREQAWAVTDFDIAQRYVQMIDAVSLPLPDEMDSTPHDIVLRWTNSGFEVHLDRDRDDVGAIDVLEAAMMKGLPPDEWPFPTAEGCPDYVPKSGA